MEGRDVVLEFLKSGCDRNVCDKNAKFTSHGDIIEQKLVNSLFKY